MDEVCGKQNYNGFFVGEQNSEIRIHQEEESKSRENDLPPGFFDLDSNSAFCSEFTYISVLGFRTVIVGTYEK